MTTRRPIRRVEADGTIVYADYKRYKPKALEDRKIGVNKPSDPRAVRWYGRWLLPLELLPDDERRMPTGTKDPPDDPYPWLAHCQLPCCSGQRRHDPETPG